MTDAEIKDLMLGAAVVAVAYLLWKQRQGATRSTAAPVQVPALPDVQGNDQDGYYIDMNTIFEGVF